MIPTKSNTNKPPEQAGVASAIAGGPNTEGALQASLHVVVDGYEGPLEVLYDLACRQKVDLAQVAILPLVDQYLAFLQQALERRLEVASSYLVMASWLTWLKSRLLLPQPCAPEEEEDSAELEAWLRARLVWMGKVRRVKNKLQARDKLGEAFFYARAGADDTEIAVTDFQANLADLVAARARLLARTRPDVYHIRPLPRMTLNQARRYLASRLAVSPQWQTLTEILRSWPAIEGRQRVVGGFLAMLEMARLGALEYEQAEAFSPIRLRRKPEAPQQAGEAGSGERV